jgi:hypothetical protein
MFKDGILILISTEIKSFFSVNTLMVKLDDDLAEFLGKEMIFVTTNFVLRDLQD